MKSKIITLMFIGTMLTTSILSGMAFAEIIGKPSFENRQGRMEMMAEVLGLSDAQKEQIRSIHEQEHTAMEQTIQQMREGREQMRALLENDTFNEEAIRSLALSQESLRTEMFVSRAKVKNQVFQLLTSDQQELANKLKPLLRKPGRHHRPMPEI